MNPITTKSITKTVGTTGLEGEQSPVQKTEPSKFDKIRADKMEKSAAAKVDMPPEVSQVSAAQKQELQAQLTRKLDAPGADPAKVMKVELQDAKVQLNQLGKRVQALPKGQALDPLRNRMVSLEQQYNNSSQLVSKLGNSKNPQDYMQIQMQMYLMTENIQLLSKVVDQCTSGVKTLLQTQI